MERPEEKQIPVCRLAILKYLATHKDKQEEYMKLSDTYLADFYGRKDLFFVLSKISCLFTAKIWFL